MIELTAERLRSLLDYSPATGLFTRRYNAGRSNSWNRRYANRLAGHVNMYGYRQIWVDGVLYYAHRLAWLYVHGFWPPSEIDHRQGTDLGDRLDNLRLATHAQNGKNQRFRKDNTSGVKGVTWCRATKRWRVNIRINGRVTNLGRFDSISAAAQIYSEAARQHHGEFARSAAAPQH